MTEKIERTNLTEYYSKYLDMYHTRVQPEHFEEFEPTQDWIALEVIPPSPSYLSSANKTGLIVTDTTRAQDALVYKVLRVGPQCTLKPGDFVLAMVNAGDRFEKSNMMVIQERDIIGKWGVGLAKKE
jgi:hypothetical protein